jgi:hypothetical protein
MNVNNFLQNEINNDRMNANTLLTIEFKKKCFLATIQECNEIFGNLLVKSCNKKMENKNKEMKNSFILKVV